MSSSESSPENSSDQGFSSERLAEIEIALDDLLTINEEIVRDLESLSVRFPAVPANEFSNQ